MISIDQKISLTTLKSSIAILISSTILAFLSACTNSGIQGTDLISRFEGVSSVETLSPTAIKLGWNLDSKYSRYNIYINSAVTPIKTETFSNSTITGLTPNTLYTFKVTGVDLSDKEIDTGITIQGQTFTNFAGLTEGGTVLKSSSEVNLTWSMNSPLVTYQVFYKKADQIWDLNQPTSSIKGLNQYLVSALEPGQNYCFFMRAYYLDNSFEPSVTNEDQINSRSICKQMTSSLLGLPSVTTNTLMPGVFPWFWTSSGDENYTTDVYDFNTNTILASRKGNGPFRSNLPIAEGNAMFYAKVRSGNQVALAEVSYNGFKLIRNSLKMRSPNQQGQRGPLLPSLINGGIGRQNFGKKIARGDFNCDGYSDLAISLPTSHPKLFSTSPYDLTGAVAIYYSYKPSGCTDANGDPVTCPVELKTDKDPSTTNQFPDPILIAYPPLQSGVQMGDNLAVGNFNGDCFKLGSSGNSVNCNQSYYDHTSSSNSEVIKIKSCDDLVIGNKDGSFYVVYGDPSVGLASGTGASSAGINEFTCDSYSNSCRTVKMTTPSGYLTNSFGGAFTTGDFNNDGYDEIALSAKKNITNPVVQTVTDILIYRGSPQGLYSQQTSGNHTSIFYNHNDLIPLGDQLEADEFGAALASVPDSRRCVNGEPASTIYRTVLPPQRKGYDLTKCDDLVIGAPGRANQRGSIFTCKINDLPTSGDKQKITGWSCKEHFPTDLNGTSARYGASVLGIKNLNAYPVLNISSNPTDTSNELPNIAGALFVGAPYEKIIYSGTEYPNAGAVYGYYVTPLMVDHAAGGIQNIIEQNNGHSVGAINLPACDKLNRNNTGGPNHNNHCENQKIYPSPPQSYSYFGFSLGALPQQSDPFLEEETLKWLAVSAPYRDVTSPTGQSLIDAGSVYLYRNDLSTFGLDSGNPVLSPKLSVGQESNPNCTNNCTWYSGGINPFSVSLFYPSNLSSYSYFGIGGIVGGSFNNDSEGDLVTAAPGFSDPAPEVGAAFIFLNSSGFDPSENTPSKTLSPHLGIEGRYMYHQMKSAGDINSDGFDDAVTHINSNGRWQIVVYYGSSLGLVKTPAPSTTAVGSQPLLIKYSLDFSFGSTFFPAGDVNGDGYRDLLIIGSQASYLYYGSSSGLISSQEPSVSPIGKNPLKFALISNEYSDDIQLSSIKGVSNLNDLYSTGKYENNFAFGDYNKDGFDDMALGLYQNFNTSTLSFDPGTGASSAQLSRVIIIYGSVNGLQINRTTGLIKSNDTDYFTAGSEPCSTVTPITCKVQLLGIPHTDATSSFGLALATIKSLGGASSALYDRLLVGEPERDLIGTNSLTPDGTKYDGAVYVYQGSNRGLNSVVIQTLVPQVTSNTDRNQKFGAQLVSLEDINQDGYQDIGIANGATSAELSRVYIFYGQNLGGSIGFYGATSINNIDYFNPVSKNQTLNSQNSLATPSPQIIRPNSLASTQFFGAGLTPLNDFNDDGYNDIAINLPNTDSTTSIESGSVVIFWGSSRGIQIENLITSPYPRCYGGTSPVCEPYQIFLPDHIAFENTWVSPFGLGDFNGDGLNDLLIGGANRGLTVGGQSASATGVVYVIY